MKVVNETIRIILFVYLALQSVYCQDGYTIQNNIHLQKIASNEGKVETIPSYSKRVTPDDFTSQSINSVKYQTVDDSNKISDYNRFDRGRTRKIFHIKNPFQQSEEEDTSNQNINKDLQDNENGASNQYAAMQYSLPPEEFLQQMRAENQYHQQQAPTPSPTYGYTATPQPPYQYSTISTATYNIGDQQNNLSPQTETKHISQVLNPNLNTYQYNTAYSFGIDAIQSTPSSVTLYLSTSSPSNQYIGTPSNNYVPSSPPIYLSSPTNLQSYYTSTLSNTQTGSPGYNNFNRYSTTIENNAFNYISNNKDNDPSVQVNHYDKSTNDVKFPINQQQQYQNEYLSSTQLPISSTYSINRGSWQDALNLNMNNLPNSRQETQTHPQTSYNYQQESQQISNPDNASSDSLRTGSMPSANNLFLSFVQPDYQTFNELKNREKETEPLNKQDIYSHGDYGWKLDGRKSSMKYDVNFPANYPKQVQGNNYQLDGSSLSSSYRYVDNKQIYDNDQAAKYNSEKLEANEFAKVAAKSQENMKKQQETFSNNYPSNTKFSQNEFATPGLSNIFRYNNQKNLANDNLNAYSQTDIVTSSPYYYPYSRENILDHTVQTLDKDKVIQSIKIDMSNIKTMKEAQKFMPSDLSNGYNSSNYNKEEQNLNQFIKPVTEVYYNDKSLVYGYNMKTKTGEVIPSDSPRGSEATDENMKKYESSINLNNLSYKPQSNMNVHPFSNSAQSNMENVPFQRITQQRPQNPSDSTSLMLNDIPYWLTQGLNNLRYPLLNSFNRGFISTGAPLTLNQNVDSHQIDVAASILNKLIRDKQLEINLKPEYNSQREMLQPTINELKVVNPYNLDLKQLPESLKGRTAANDFYSQTFHNQLNPVRWDMTQLQQYLLKNDNAGQYGAFNDGMISASSPFFELHNSGRYPYQKVKYSRSQEEEESLIPITGSNHIHPIGAVIEQDDLENENKDAGEIDAMESSSDDLLIENDSEKPKSHSHRMVNSRRRHPNSLSQVDRYYPHRKFPSNTGEPYPLLKPPPIHNLKSRSRSKVDYNRRQRGNKPKFSRIVKREPLFEDESLTEDLEPAVPALLRPPPFAADDKSDHADNES